MDNNRIKKKVGERIRRNKFMAKQRVCKKHNLLCHWADVCRECVLERIKDNQINCKLRPIHQELLISNIKKIKKVKLKRKKVKKMKAFL